MLAPSLKLLGGPGPLFLRLWTKVEPVRADFLHLFSGKQLDCNSVQNPLVASPRTILQFYFKCSLQTIQTF